MPYPWESSDTPLHTPSPYPAHHSNGTPLHPHRVQGRAAARLARFACLVLVSILLFAGLITFLLWLSFRPHRPRFNLTSFSAGPGLASNTTFAVSAHNPNRDIGIYYGRVNDTLFYRDQRVGTAAANVTPVFYQPPKDTTVFAGTFTGEGMEDERIRNRFADDLKAAGRVFFWLQLATTVRFRAKAWDTHTHRMYVSCEVAVGTDGVALPEYRDRSCSLYFV